MYLTLVVSLFNGVFKKEGKWWANSSIGGYYIFDFDLHMCEIDYYK